MKSQYFTIIFMKSEILFKRAGIPMGGVVSL